MTMRRSCTLIVAAAIMLLGTPSHAQKATEVLIPIGQSPGVSRVTSVIGTIASCDQAAGVVTVAAEDGQHTARLVKETKIYLDRSAAKKSGALGSQSDCQQGRRAEVKYVYEGGKRTARAEWIKIQVE